MICSKPIQLGLVSEEGGTMSAKRVPMRTPLVFLGGCFVLFVLPLFLVGEGVPNISKSKEGDEEARGESGIKRNPRS